MSDSNFKEFLLDIVPTDDDKKIKGSKLSAKHQVLLCYFGYRQCSITISKRDASKKNCGLRDTMFFKNLVYLLFPNKDGRSC